MLHAWRVSFHADEIIIFFLRLEFESILVWKGRQSLVVWGGMRLWQTHRLYHKCNHHLIQGLKPGDINTPFYIHIYVHTHLHTYRYTQIHTYIDTHRQRRIHMYTCAHAHTCRHDTHVPKHPSTCTYKHTVHHTQKIHMCIRIYMHTHIHTEKHTCMYAQAPTSKHTCIDTRVYTLMHVHTCAPGPHPSKGTLFLDPFLNLAISLGLLLP